MPWLRRIESAIARDLVDDDDLFAEFDVRGALRADAAGRASYYNAMWNLGVLSVNEIRAAENLNPVEGGDTRFVQLNMTTLDKAVAQPEPVVEEIVTEEIPAEPVAATPEPVVEEGPQIADVSLNGAQVSSLLEIVTQLNAGLLTEQGAKAVIAAAFPGIPPETVNQIIAGTSTTPVVVPDRPSERDADPVARSLPESRSMTLSIDFDRTFSAEPQLWGEFARKAVADGNTVVMVSRRPDTEEDRKTVTDTLGEYADAFSQVLLVGERLKDEAAKEAGVEVDVWVDDSPQTVKPPMDCGCDEQRNCGTGSGGFSAGNTCGKGGGGGGGGGSSDGGSPGGGSSGGDGAGSGSGPGGLKQPSKKHDVKLPKSKKRLTIDQGNEAMKQLGYKVGKTSTKKVGKGWVTVVSVTDSTGHTATLTADEVKDIVYGNQK